MAFFGAIIKPGLKPEAFVPPPEEWSLHLSQAALTASVPEGKRVSLMIKLQGADELLCLATLTAGRLDSVPLDLFLSEYCEFLCDGDYEIHLSGYYSPMHEEDGPGGDEEGLFDGDDDDEEEDEEEEDTEDMDDDDSEEDDEEEEDLDASHYGWPSAAPGGLKARKPSSVVIEELDDDKPAAAPSPAAAAPAAPAAAASGKKDKAAAEAAQAGGKQGKAQQQQQQQGKAQQQQQQGKAQQAAAEVAGGKGDMAAAGSKRPAQEEAVAAPSKKPEGNGSAAAVAAAAAEGSAKKRKGEVRRYENGMEIENVAMGQPDGKLAKAGKKVVVRYAGRLKSNGKEFDKNNKFTFRLGVGEVIKGWDVGVAGMRVGDKRRLTVPPQMAYGSSGVRGTIPPNAALEFDVELLDVK